MKAATSILEYVTDKKELWESLDPVRPDLDAEFKKKTGRSVVGLKGQDGKWKAFMCYARTFLIPKDINELDIFTAEDGNIVVPYTVWSHERGAGKKIIKELLKVSQNKHMGIDRVVTLSPLTEMARKFHTRNGAEEFRMNETTVNFEYSIPKNDKDME